ncbi:MAG: hypothetical protein D6725_14890 [Planctomycetota bacterium]|nr:MAG: hypothetical protein D6725_14890 [Planctomycetota bacterium]
MSQPNVTTEQPSPRDEHTFHSYQTNRVPWYVWTMWGLFWLFVVVYLLIYFVPAIQIELVNPP